MRARTTNRLVRNESIDAVEKVGADIQIKLLVEFADASGAGDVNFGDIVANHIDTDKNESLIAQTGANLIA